MVELQPADRLASAVEKTIAQAVFHTESLVLVRDQPPIAATSVGYCDLSVPLVAAQLTVDYGDDQVQVQPSFMSGSSLYQWMPGDRPSWLALDVFGIGATDLMILYWLRGATSVELGETSDRFQVEVDLDVAASASSSEVALSLERDVQQPEGDFRRSAVGEVRLDVQRLVQHIELVMEGSPETFFSLTLTPTHRQAVELPVATSFATPEAYIKAILEPEQDTSGDGRVI